MYLIIFMYLFIYYFYKVFNMNIYNEISWNCFLNFTALISQQLGKWINARYTGLILMNVIVL